jgi:hypothetical protein
VHVLLLLLLSPRCVPQGVSWNLGVTAAELISTGAIPPCVCVAIDSAGPYRCAFLYLKMTHEKYLVQGVMLKQGALEMLRIDVLFNAARRCGVQCCT